MSENICGRACKGCIYFVTVGGYPSCDYIFIEGKHRPCPPGKGCTVKDTRKNKGRTEDVQTKS